MRRRDGEEIHKKVEGRHIKSVGDRDGDNSESWQAVPPLYGGICLNPYGGYAGQTAPWINGESGSQNGLGQDGDRIYLTVHSRR